MIMLLTKVQVGNDQEKAQSEKKIPTCFFFFFFFFFF